VNDFLVTYLDSIDEDLLQYLDDDEELSIVVVKRMRDYTVALLDGSITPVALDEDWSDWFPLVGAFVAAYGWEGVDDLEDGATFLDEIGAPEVEIRSADREFLEALVVQLDVYPSEHPGR